MSVANTATVIDAAVLYPSIGLNFWAITDPEAAVVLARAYNDWLAGYCEADPARFHGAAMVPLQNPEAAASPSASTRGARCGSTPSAAGGRSTPCCCTRYRTRSSRCWPSAICAATASSSAIRAKDADALRSMFAPDAELVTVVGTLRGPDAIAEFYAGTAFAIGDLDPRLGPFIIGRDRVAVEIDLRAGGASSPVADFFTIAGGKIQRLVVYHGPQT